MGRKHKYHTKELTWTWVKGKVGPVLNLAPRYEEVLGEWRYSSTHSFDLGSR